MENYLTPDEAATLKGCSARYIRLLFSQGRITGKRVSERIILLDRKSVEAHAIDNTKRGRTSKREEGGK
jgi:hypothetical protein